MTLEWTTLPAPLDLLGECPLPDGVTQTLYWTDIPGTAMKSRHPQSAELRVGPMPDEVGSFALRRPRA